MALDSSGNLFIADTWNNRIRRVDAVTKNISTVAGTGTYGFGGDGGAATAAQLDTPQSVALDSSGNLFIADTWNNRIRKVDATTKNISTVAGNGTAGFGGDDGAATAAQLDSPQSVAVDSSGNLFIADTDNHRIRKVDAATGFISTVAGDGTFGFSGDGAAATAAQLNLPLGVAVDASGNLFIADTDNHRIRKVDAATGVISTVAGGGSGDGGAATAAQLNLPLGVAVDASGNLFIAEYNNQRIRKIDTDGNISTVAGNGTHGFSGDGVAAVWAQLDSPSGVAVDSSGNLFIADYNNRIRKVGTDGNISTVAGTGSSGFSGDGAAATAARLSSPSGVALDASDNLFIAEYDRIRKVDAVTGNIISTVAGGGVFSQDGVAATAAWLQYASDVAVDASGNLYIADWNNNRIRKVDFTATPAPAASLTASPTTIAGGQSSTLTVASTNAVSAVIQPGNLFVTLDNTGAGTVTVSPTQTVTYALTVTDAHGGQAIDTATVTVSDGPTSTPPDPGTITTVAGPGDFGGDGAAAAAAWMRNPSSVAVDGSGNLYIADSPNHRIRKVDTDGNISTIAGNGAKGFSGDGTAATAAQLNFPGGLALDSAGNLYIADGSNHRIRKVDAATGFISTVAGDGTRGGQRRRHRGHRGTINTL